MIINTGLRTDIPAYFSKWLMNRIYEGFVYVRNPYYPDMVTKYMLDPDVVDCMDFCTKNPAPMLPYIKELSKFNMLWYVTITPYGKDIEPNVPDKEEVMESFIRLAELLPNCFLGWRYDPIFINQDFDVQRHIECFESMAKKLHKYTHDCTFSFLNLYEKVKRNAPDLRPPTHEEQLTIGREFARIASKYGILLHSCCEGTFLSEFGIDVTGCKSQAIVERSIHKQLTLPKIKNVRKDCPCLMGADIGAYDTCMHFCTYCYANVNRDKVLANMKRHVESSPILIGTTDDIGDLDNVKIAKQTSFINKNLTLI